jgi:hypothetical protein
MDSCVSRNDSALGRTMVNRYKICVFFRYPILGSYIAQIPDPNRDDNPVDVVRPSPQDFPPFVITCIIEGMAVSWDIKTEP